MINLSNISVSYGNQAILKEFSLNVQQGEHIALMGPSGSGKTTLLKLIANQLRPNSGEVHLSSNRISYMFQEPRLIPWLTAEENVNLVLGDNADTLPQARLWLQRVGLSEAEQKYPSSLSGGMKQRVALARALAFNGDIFLLDEPLSSLDESLADDMLSLIKMYTKDKTVIFVTHSTRQAEQFADKIYVLKEKNT